MALTNYSELKTAIANWLDRSDLDDRIPEFIQLAEARHRRDFKIRRMETRVTASTIADTEYYSLPDNFVAMRNIQLNTDPKTALEYMTPEQMDRVRGGSTTGKPKAYSIIGNNFQLRPIPDGVYQIEMLYFKYFTALSDSNTTNDVLTDFPDLYLYGSLAETSPFLMQDERLAVWSSLYKEGVRTANESAQRGRVSAAPLQMSARRVV